MRANWIVISFLILGVLGNGVVLDCKTVRAIEFDDAAREAFHCALLLGGRTNLFQSFADLQTITAIAVAEFESCSAVVELFAEAGAFPIVQFPFLLRPMIKSSGI
jgi:hypothetical protein